MEIARLIKMRTELSTQLKDLSEQPDMKIDFYKIWGRLDMLDDIIAEILNGVKSIDIDSLQFDNEKITYELYDTLAIQLECDFPNRNLTMGRAAEIAFDRMEELKIEEAQLVMLYAGKIIATKKLTIK